MPPPQPARPVWPPEPGFFTLRLVRRGWAVPAQITHDGTAWCAIIDEQAYLPHKDPAWAEGVERIWTGGVRVESAHYHWLIALKRWAFASSPDHPCLFPRRPIDPAQLAPIEPSLRHPMTGAQA
jgi:hypothetical protein